MKLTLTLLLVGLLQVSAESYSQSTRLSMEVDGKQVAEVLRDIENMSDFRFFYQREQVNVERRVQHNFNEQTIEEILPVLFPGDEIEHKVYSDKLILLAPNEILTEMNTAIEAETAPQDRTISGTVSDEAGDPLIGVSIAVKGALVGTITDAEGNYSLADVPEDAILVYSYIGMITQEIAVGNQTSINVSLELDAIGIEEVVAIGYGTMKKSNLTGSVAKVGIDDIENRVVARVDEAVQGKMAGVLLQQTSGVPGAAPVIRIRGNNSITEGNQPLWVIDGMPVENAEVIANLNMSDVESLEVLKDAASAAIYGSRGGNGVVIVTTKKGRTGKPQISYNMYYGLQRPEKLLELFTGPEHAEYEVERREWLLSQNPDFDENTPNDDRPTNLRIDPNWKTGNVESYDHQDEMFVTAPIQNHNLSINGGTDKTMYHMSMGYLNQDGVIKNSNFNRYSFRVNLESKIQKRLKVGISLAPSFSTQIDVNSEGKDQTVTGMLLAPPTANLEESYWDDASKSHQHDYMNYYGYGSGPAAVYYILNNLQQEYKRNQLLSSAFIDVDIADGLSFRSTVYYRLNFLKSNDYRDEKTGRGTIGAVLNNSYNSNLTWENTLNYAKDFGNHSVTGLLGYSSQEDYFENVRVVGKGYASDARLTLNNAAAITEWDQDIQEWSMISMFARATYGYDSRYLLTASIRRDGSSRFGSENKWGVFPAVSAAWIISNEAFMSQNTFSTLKLRGSYGATGNNRIGNYRPYASLLSSNAVLGRSESTVIGLIPGSFENQALTWEKNQTTNIGLDVGILENRVFVSVDAYSSVTDNLLLDVPVPHTTGYYKAIQNIGEVSNKGIEMEIASRNISAADFTWNSSVVYSYNKNEVTAMGPDEAPIKNGDFWCRDCSYTGIGYPIGSFYLYETAGIFMTQEEVESSALYRDEGVGDVKWVDQNGDGVVNAEDRTVLGQPSPVWNFGFTNTLKYKGFDLSIFINGSGGHDTFFAWSRYISRPQVRVHTADFNDRWRSDSQPGNGIIPRVTSDAATNGRDEEHDRWLYPSDWWRIKNITIGYNISSSTLRKIHVSSLRIYLAGDNLLLFTKYPGYNPEGGLKPMPASGTTQTETPFNPRSGIKQSPSYNLGMDFGSTPLARRFIIGVNITF